MRVYEFSKKYKTTNKEVLDKLHAAGFHVKSHMSILEENAIEFLEKAFDSSSSAPAEVSVATAIPSEEKKETNVQKKSLVSIEKKVPIASSKGRSYSKVSSGSSVTSSFPSLSSPPLQVKAQAMRVGDLAAALSKPVSELILQLLKWGTLANKNMMISEEFVIKLADHFGVPVARPEKQGGVSAQRMRSIAAHPHDDLAERVPIVVVVGHVDHGKTTLLDFIRKTRVAAKERGGITQHLGAYEAHTSQGIVVFLDTPGHEAFAKIRGRGVRIADIVVLVVAADDGVMPQTADAIKLARSLEVPIIVAINKIDKVDAMRIEGVKRELAQHELMLEEWGGDVIVVPISAKSGDNVNQLLEMIILQAQMMELSTSKVGPARGYVLESKVEKGRGPVATVLCLQGQLAIGDYFIAGNTVGRVTSLTDSYGNRISKVGASVPVQVAGFDQLASAGDAFEVVDASTYKNFDKKRVEGRVEISKTLLSNQTTIPLILKTDTDSSREAIVEAIDNLSKKSEIGFSIISTGIGGVNESDVMYASSTGAQIVTLHVKAEPSAALLASKYGVHIRSFYIIYELLDALKSLVHREVKPKMVRKKVGEAIVRKIFDIKNLGVIAGSYVSDGYFTREGTVIIWRGNKKVGEGKINGLQREKRAVKQVYSGFECGFLVQDFNEWQVDDRVECFIETPKV